MATCRPSSAPKHEKLAQLSPIGRGAGALDALALLAPDARAIGPPRDGSPAELDNPEVEPAERFRLAAERLEGEDAPRQMYVVRQPSGALDGFCDVGDDAVTPASRHGRFAAIQPDGYRPGLRRRRRAPRHGCVRKEPARSVRAVRARRAPSGRGHRPRGPSRQAATPSKMRPFSRTEPSPPSAEQPEQTAPASRGGDLSTDRR
jgi:hypothetical protein